MTRQRKGLVFALAASALAFTTSNALAYKVFRCWVSEYQALPDLDANANAVAIQTIKLENEGWERDYDVSEPAEPNFTEPA